MITPSTPDQSVVTGILLSVLIADESMQTELYRAPDSAGAPGTFALLVTLDPGVDSFFDLLPLDGLTYWYKCRHVLSGYTASGYTAVVSTQSRQWSSMPQTALAKQVYPLDRTVGFTDRAFAVQANDGTGQIIAQPVQQTDGVSNRVIAKGYLSGTAKHGDVITFPSNFQNVPAIFLQGGILLEPRAKWGAVGDGSETGAYNTALPTYEDFAALGLSVSGFTVRARLRQKGGTTARHDDFPSGNSEVNVGDNTVLTLANAPSATDTYTVHWKVHIDATSSTHGTPYTVTLVVAVDSSPTGSVWTERYTNTYVNSIIPTNTNNVLDWTNESVPITVSGLTSSSQMRVRIKSITISGLGTLNSLTVKGLNKGTDGDPSYGCEYNTASDNFACKTIDAADTITWKALAVS